MDHFLINAFPSLGSICYTCDSRWDLRGNPVYSGKVVIMKLVDPVHLPFANLEVCTASRPASRAGRPPGSFDKKPRKNTGLPRSLRKRKEEF
jgi:hypothetical protein